MIYLDNAATTPVLPEALQAAWPYLTNEFGNASSKHELGFRAAKALTEAREKVANWLGCRASEIVFTSSGTESNNLAIKGIALASPRGKHIISARTEHESVLQCLDYLERIHGFEIEWMPLSETGEITIDSLRGSIRDDTTLVTLMLANNEIGTIHPIAEFAKIASSHKVPFHTDAVQGAGWLDLTVGELGVTALSLSGHKFGAPKGSGILYLNAKTQVEPLLHGGGQEHERRSSTENVAWAVAQSVALQALNPKPEQQSLLGEFIEKVTTQVSGAKLTGSPDSRHPGIASFTFEGINGETLLLELENEGVICSSGSACSADSDEPSHVLTALGVQESIARTALRFSLSHSTNRQELELAFDALVRAHQKISSAGNLS